MANSAQYYRSYIKHLQAVDKYQRYIDYLAGVRNTLNSDFSDNIQDINGKITELHQDLDDSVRHNSTFDSNVDLLDERKEKDVGSDGDLSKARDYIVAEISSLQNKRDAEQRAADQAYRDYQDALRREEEERREALKNLFKW